MSNIDYIKMAHDQLDEWIEGKIKPNIYLISSDILDLGILKRTMENARQQWLDEHPPVRYVTIRGKEYTEDEIVEALDWQCREPHCPWKHNDKGECK